MMRDDQAAAGALPRILYWYDTTGLQPWEGNVQRVTRWLARALANEGAEVLPVMFDTHRRDIVCSTMRRRPPTWLDDSESWLFVTEMPLSLIALDLDPLQLGRAHGLKTAALVHDLIPMKLAEQYEGAHALYARYYRMFADADLVFATTESVFADLRAHLAERELRVPTIAILPPAAQFADTPRCKSPSPPRAAGEPLALLTVGTMEPHENLPRLLRAIQTATRRGAALHLTIVGKRTIHRAYETEVDALVARLPNVTYIEMPDDAALAGLYANIRACICGSCEEVFSRPVFESLWLGRPCLCHETMDAVAPGAGTLFIDMTDEQLVADILVALDHQPEVLARLAVEAAALPLRTWNEVARDMLGYLRSAVD